jgi:hypothetical protein
VFLHEYERAIRDHRHYRHFVITDGGNLSAKQRKRFAEVARDRSGEIA